MSTGAEKRQIAVLEGKLSHICPMKHARNKLFLTSGTSFSMKWRQSISHIWKKAPAEVSGDGPITELAPHLKLGQRGELLAAEYLQRQGYRLVASNFKVPVGRNLNEAIVHAEIDIVAYEGTTLCFIEVKTRTSDRFATPEVNVDRHKQRQVARAARAYRRMYGLMGEPYRYDVVSVIVPPAQENEVPPPPRLELLRNFWTDEKLRKRHWSHTPSDY